MAEEKSIADRVHDIFAAQFGTDWRKDISLTLRADSIYWLVWLAEQGIEAKRAEFKANPNMRPVEMAASLASWKMDLENLLSKVQAVLPPKKGGKNSK